MDARPCSDIPDPFELRGETKGGFRLASQSDVAADDLGVAYALKPATA